MISFSPEQRWRRIEDLARGALKRQGRERSLYLDTACHQQPELRAKVDELVAAYDTAQSGGTVLSRPAFVPTPTVQLEPGYQLGPDRIVEQVAESNMAAVYRAERKGITVAIKVARRSFDAACLERQFQVERRILELFDHPNITRSLDGGILADGRPYMVVEFVEGLAINEHCSRRSLPLAERLRLFRQVCDTVEYVHGKGVIHRDIKPINVLVTAEDVPMLLDFGIALGPWPESDESANSPASRSLMTPQYASPEQLLGQRATPLSDIYSLGLLLYELLTGRLPYESAALGPREMAELLAEHEPLSPSSAATCPEIRRQLAGGLEAIVLKAIARQPVNRPGRAARLAQALQPWLH